MGKIHRWGLVIAFLIIASCAYIGLKLVFSEDKNTEVPAVTGMQLVDAVDALQKKGLLAKVDKVDSHLAADVVVSQNLPAGEKVSSGKVVLLRVSKGGAVLPVPDVRGLNFEEGVKRLSDAGFKVDKITRVTDKLKPTGTIIAQNPASPQQVAANVMVSLLVSSGASGENSFVTVPDLRGQQKDTAVTMIEQLGLRLGRTSEEASATLPAGSVVSTRPRSGAKVPVGSVVNVTLARTPAASEIASDAPPESAQDKERAEAIRRVVIKETEPETIPSKIPATEEPGQSAQTPKPEEAKPQTEAPKTETETETKSEQRQKTAAAPTKTAKVRYQAPPLIKPLSLKIEMTDESGTRVLKDGTAKSGEYISMDVPYVGEAHITIFLGGDFVWQDRFN